MSILVDLEPRGNAAFPGNLVCRLRDDRGIVLNDRSVEVAIFKSMGRRVDIALSGLGECEFEVEIEPNTNR